MRMSRLEMKSLNTPAFSYEEGVAIISEKLQRDCKIQDVSCYKLYWILREHGFFMSTMGSQVLIPTFIH